MAHGSHRMEAADDPANDPFPPPPQHQRHHARQHHHGGDGARLPVFPPGGEPHGASLQGELRLRESVTVPGGGWDSDPHRSPARQTASRGGDRSRAAGSRADGVRSSTTVGGYPSPPPQGHGGGRQGAGARGGAGAGPPPMVDPLSIQLPMPGGVVASQDDAAFFFKSMGHVLSPQSPSGVEAMSPTARPPPAGMRGALSWGVGPNAFENDGRPGTRGGGTAYDLEGRPLTRSGMRPGSRMQAGRPSTTQSPGPGGGSPTAFAQPPGGALASQQSIDLSSSSGPSSMRGLAAAAAGASLNRRPNAQQAGAQAPHGPAEPSQPSLTGDPPPTGRGGRASRQAPPAGGGGGGQPRGGGQGPNSMSKVDEEGDVDAFLAALSDEEVESNTNMDDLSKYLSTLDQDRASSGQLGAAGHQRHRSRGREAAGAHAAHDRPHGKHHHGKASHHHRAEHDSRSESPPAAPKPEAPPAPTKAQLKTIRAATKLLDVLIEQAIRTSEVNRLIKAAEDKALADEAAYGVHLAGDNWQDSVRGMTGGLPADEFSLLQSKVAAAGSKVPTAAAVAQHQQRQQALLSAPLPPMGDNDFAALPGLQGGPGQLRPVAMAAGGAKAGGGLGLPSAAPLLSGGMGRYARRMDA